MLTLTMLLQIYGSSNTFARSDRLQRMAPRRSAVPRNDLLVCSMGHIVLESCRPRHGREAEFRMKGKHNINSHRYQRLSRSRPPEGDSVFADQ